MKRRACWFLALQTGSRDVECHFAGGQIAWAGEWGGAVPTRYSWAHLWTHNVGSGTKSLDRGWTLSYSGVIIHKERRWAGVVIPPSPRWALRSPHCGCKSQEGRFWLLFVRMHQIVDSATSGPCHWSCLWFLWGHISAFLYLSIILLFHLCSNPHLWSWILGSDWKNDPEYKWMKRVTFGARLGSALEIGWGARPFRGNLE